MAHVLLTTGPTRAYLDDVRYLTNASSGRMGVAISESLKKRGHRVTVVSGPVAVDYPRGVRVIRVTTTGEMLDASLAALASCDGVIAAAAPCDFEPVRRVAGKIPRQGSGISLGLKPTVDVIATLARRAKPGQWMVAFALEPGANPARALEKITAKRCDLIVVNGLEAVDSSTTSVAVYDRSHASAGAKKGTKKSVADWLVRLIETRLIDPL